MSKSKLEALGKFIFCYVHFLLQSLSQPFRVDVIVKNVLWIKPKKSITTNNFATRIISNIKNLYQTYCIKVCDILKYIGIYGISNSATTTKFVIAQLRLDFVKWK